MKRLAISCAVVVVAACAAGPRSFGDDPQPGLPVDAGVPDAPDCGIRCSRDLKSVLDGCDGHVMKKCDADHGCGDGDCITACNAAVASKGSAGCEFYAVPPDDESYGPGGCYVAMVANTWDRAIKIDARYGDDPLDISKSVYTADNVGTNTVYTPLAGPLPPGLVALIFLSQGPSKGFGFTACPDGITPALAADPLTHGTGITKAFRITADAPVSAYAIFPYGGAISYYPTATILMPVSAWGTNYYAVSAWEHETSPADIGHPTLQIVASEDGTEVRIRPTVDITDGPSLVGAAKGLAKAYTLSRGQVLQITQNEELTGSPIESSKPVGVFGGSRCVYIPTGIPACDLTQQQLPPISQWGSEYALVPFHGRVDGIVEVLPWRIVGAVDGTKLAWDPGRPPGAPEVLSAGQVVTFTADQLGIVKSQDKDHPFFVASYMTGAASGATDHAGSSTTAFLSTMGDPDFVDVVPSDQFLDRYVFFTDYTFPDTTLTIVRKKTTNGFAPVTVDCAGAIQGWKPLGKSGDYEYAWVDLTKGAVPISFDGVACGYGRHEATSDGPFSVTVWGLGEAASYGYPGGMGSRPITSIVVPVR
jgi:hypothetical protein